MTSTIAYSTTTGQDATDIDVDIVVEHHRPANLKVTDPRYGLKTAVRTEAERKQQTAEREQFLATRRDALSKQRDNVVDRLVGLQKEIRRVIARLETGETKGEANVNESFDRLTRMGRTEEKLKTDIARLNDKIGA